MDKSEFERIKAEEKAHLQKLRALKQQHRGAQRMASTANALNAMRNPELEAETDAMTDKLMRDAALSEARFELATEGLAPVTGNAEEVDREALAKAGCIPVALDVCDEHVDAAPPALHLRQSESPATTMRHGELSLSHGKCTSSSW